MAKQVFEILRDDDGTVAGYKLGKHYLMKHYYWMNSYDWVINKDGCDYYYDFEFWKLLDAGEIELAHSCKQGKQRLIELAAQEDIA